MKGKSAKVWPVVIGLLLLAGIAGMFFVRANRETGHLVRVTWNDQSDPDRYPLTEDRTLVYEGEDGRRNVVTIQDGMVSVTEASCPDQICVKHIPTDQTADPIVCLPNRLVVEVVPTGQ